MKPLEENQRKLLPETQTFTKKYSYLNAQNPDSANIQSSRPKILQTISEQAFSEDKGSITNRSQSVSNTYRIRKNQSEKNVNYDPLSSFKNNSYQTIRTMSHLVDNFQNTNRMKVFQELDVYNRKVPSAHRISEVYSLSGYECCECPLYLNKIAELQSSYELLLMAKNEELQECKIIINGLQEKLKQIQKRSLYQIEKNKKFRSQIQKKSTQDHYHRERENQIIQYLKNRQIVLLEQMKELQNKVYIKDIRTRNHSSASKSVQSHHKLHSNSKGFISASNHGQFNPRGKNKQNIIQFNQHRSISQCSAKTFDQQFQINQNVPNGSFPFLSANRKQMSSKNQLYSSAATKMTAQLIQRVPLNQILKKANQIECLRDNLLVSELKIKIQQTKSLENIIFAK